MKNLMNRAGKAGLTLLLGLLLALPAMAQEDALIGLPGYVDFGELSNVYGEPKVMINLGGSILKFVSGMTQDDPEASALLEKLKGVRISVYSVGGKPDAALQNVNQIKGILGKASWEPIVQVNDEGEQVQIFVKLSGEVMEGMTVMAVDQDEAVFINIIGQLDPAQLSQVMEKFDVDINSDLEFN